MPGEGNVPEVRAPVNLPDSIRKADDTLYEIFHNFNLFDFVNPINHQAERDKFMQAWEDRERYQPIYEYGLVPVRLNKSKRMLEALEFGVTALDACFAQIRSEYVALLDLAQSRGSSDITVCSKKIFSEPSDELVTEARKTIRTYRSAMENQRPEIGIKLLAESFRDRLREDRIEGWDVQEDPKSVGLAQVDRAHHKIRLQTGLVVTSHMADRLISHQVGVHVYRSVNGERQPFKVFGLGFDQHMQTEEGLALELEERAGHLLPGVRKSYAGRVLASHLASTKSFFDIFSILVEFFSPEEAFTLTQRSKRGIQDTSQPGGLIQDHIYSQGKKEVKALTSTDFKLLYTGKISVRHLEIVSELLRDDQILEPAFIPSVFYG